MNIHCPHCGAAMELSAGRQACAHCGGVVEVEQAAPPVIPKVLIHNGRDGRIAILYLGGAVFMFAFPVGTVIGLLLIIYAHRLDRESCRCGGCGNVVENSRVKVCPACHVEFSGVMR